MDLTSLMDMVDPEEKRAPEAAAAAAADPEEKEEFPKDWDEVSEYPADMDPELLETLGPQSPALTEQLMERWRPWCSIPTPTRPPCIWSRR